jgi:signal peptidase I
MWPALRPGDLVVTVRASTPRHGDVVLFREPRRRLPVVHRIVDIDGDAVITRGDNNRPGLIERVSMNSIEAKVRLRIPWLGHLGLWLRRRTGGTYECT